MTSDNAIPPIMRGRRPGKIERMTCPVCGRECAKRKDGRPFRHQRLRWGRVTFSNCPAGGVNA